MSSTTPLDRWLAPRLAARAADTLREINDDPLTVSWWRDGAQIGTLTLRVAESSVGGNGGTTYGQDSASTKREVVIVAPAGTLLRRDDRLVAPQSVVYRVLHVPPAQAYRTEASAEVESQ